MRSGQFFLTVMQNMFRRMKPASPVPQTLDQLAQSDLSMVSYLERFGGYGDVRDMGMATYILAFVVDQALRGEMDGLREHLALMVVAMEQYAMDGRWDMAFLLTLMEDPPPQMFGFRSNAIPSTGRLRAFAPRCPQRCAIISLAYMKELDFIQNRSAEQSKKEPNPPHTIQAKRPKKFPKADNPKQPSKHTEYRTDGQ